MGKGQVQVGQRYNFNFFLFCLVSYVKTSGGKEGLADVCWLVCVYALLFFFFFFSKEEFKK